MDRNIKIETIQDEQHCELTKLNCRYWETKPFTEEGFISSCLENNLEETTGTVFGVSVCDERVYGRVMHDVFGRRRLHSTFPLSKVRFKPNFFSYVLQHQYEYSEQIIRGALGWTSENAFTRNGFRYDSRYRNLMEHYLRYMALSMKTDFYEYDTSSNNELVDGNDAVTTFYEILKGYESSENLYRFSLGMARYLSSFNYNNLPNELKNILTSIYGPPILEPHLKFKFCTSHACRISLCNFSEFYFSTDTVLAYGSHKERPLIIGKFYTAPAISTVIPVVGANGWMMLPHVIYRSIGSTSNQLAIANSINRMNEKMKNMNPKRPIIDQTVLHLYPAREYMPRNMFGVIKHEWLKKT